MVGCGGEDEAGPRYISRWPATHWAGTVQSEAAAAEDMKVLVILSSVLAVALAKPGYLGLGVPAAVPVPADAPDVAVAKAAHLATQAAEAARNTLGVPVASIVPADEPHVAVAKAAHLNIQAAEAARNTLGVPAIAAAPVIAASRYAVAAPVIAGPANIVIGPGGVPLDTPEVASAKAAHAVAHAQSAALAAATPADPVSGLPLAAVYAAGIPAIHHADAIAHLQYKAALLG
ncbi:cuticle protein 18.7-like [Schistocerca cancellata]|uniref:cuticle protein 18.7-like n=1 Tax=Schistocerca cancellata TaxID=274614 RepID=UPI0021188C2F|nr:cuticle protein 18.7-like [Schistocerca cancellata]